MRRGTGILPVPNGPTMMHGLFAERLETNWCGSVRVREGLSLVRYRVDYTGQSTIDVPPTRLDLIVPPGERPAVARIASELDLAGRPADEVVRRLEAFFSGNFVYRLYQKPRRYGPMVPPTPLSQFLLNDRGGHCEYFASATVLLLRQAGIPARYAIGFGVPEGRSGQTINVRGRDGHAWALAYIDGAWRDVDTTPGGTTIFRADDLSIPQRASDFVFWLRYQFLSWRYYTSQERLMRILFWVLIPLLVWMLWRIFGKQRRVRTGQADSSDRQERLPGRDSAFYQVEQQLTQAGLGRRPGEPIGAWITRLEQPPKPVANAGLLRTIVHLHYAYRFDPEGETENQRQAIRERVDEWMGKRASP